MGSFFEFVVIQEAFFIVIVLKQKKMDNNGMNKTGGGPQIFTYSISMFLSENFVYFYLI